MSLIDAGFIGVVLILALWFVVWLVAVAIANMRSRSKGGKWGRRP